MSIANQFRANSWPPQWMKTKYGNKNTYISIALFTLLVFVSIYSLVFKSSTPDFGWNGSFDPDSRIDIHGSNAAVVSDSETCSRMGLKVLKQGGTAADAAVQVCLCIGTITPNAAGIGGGGFIIHRSPEGNTTVIDARETAPSGAFKDMFNDNPLRSKIGGLASGVPGELAGLDALWKLGGTVPWKDLVMPVVELNEQGYIRSEHLRRATNVYLNLMSERAPGAIEELMKISDWDWLLKRPDSSHIKRPEFASTLRKIANEGIDVFYNGEIAESLVNITAKTGGILTLQDFKDYKVVFRKPITGRFMNRTVFTTSEPTSGPALLMGLNVFDKFLANITAMNLTEADIYESNEDVVQVVIETMKWMAAARSELGDPDFIDNEKINQIIGEEWALKVLDHISTNHTLPSWEDYHPSYEMNDPQGTTHFVVVDKYGGSVSMTSTVNLPFGNFVCDPQTGIVMNSEMDDFSIPENRNSFDLAPSIYNFVEPGKRPLSSAVPNIIVDANGEIEFVGGAAGGSKILTSTFLTIVRAVAFNVSALNSVAYPRYHHQLIPEVLYYENNSKESAFAASVTRKHNVSYMDPASTVNVIHKQRGKLHAIGDFYRKRALGAAY